MTNKISFETFKTNLLAEMWKRFGLTQNDSRYENDKTIKDDYDSFMSVEDCCDWLEYKDDLDRIDLEPFTVKNK